MIYVVVALVVLLAIVVSATVYYYRSGGHGTIRRPDAWDADKIIDAERMHRNHKWP